jgi:putative membrane protein
MQNRSFLHYLIISLKGVAMGAADVVPGVSGGTIAFISGIYEELLTSISAFNFSTLKLLKQKGFKAAWNAVNGSFLVALLAGIFISIVSLAKVISWLLDNSPILVWSFFFGLVLASIIFVAKQISKWNFITVLLGVLGAILAFYITTLQPLISENSSPIFLFLAGALAICAMILPGISGAFILVLLGAYKPVLDAVHTKDFKLIAILATGAIIGLLSFSKILKWLFNNYKNFTLAVLTGFILGSLNKIWPWKQVLESTVIEGKVVILKEISVLPGTFEGNTQFIPALGLALLGFLTIFILEKLANKF